MKPVSKQQGFALLIFVAVLTTASAALAVKILNNGNSQIARDKITAAALAQARDALIGSTSTQSQLASTGYLNLPDLGSGVNYPEGSAAGTLPGNYKDYSVIGKVPWKTLKISPLRDGQGECLWYVISGRFKNMPKTDVFNWDTQGQLDVIDSNNNPIANNVAALIVAPTHPQSGQNRASDPVYTQCGGNYDTSNYLNSYFTGSTNNRVASNSNNKSFVMANNDHFLFVTIDDIFRPIIHRTDFSTQISALLDDPYFLTVTNATGSKGTNTINCNGLSAANHTFCINWKEMLLLTELPVPSNITIINNGVTTITGPCSFVLIFGGQKTANQVRLTNANKSDPANYLEAPNLTAFDTPTAHSSNFSGALTFSASNPGADLLRCL
ncbi:MAG: hypothetical protein WC216_07120 [Gallionella sp.]